jgi:hypothetical protein
MRTDWILGTTGVVLFLAASVGTAIWLTMDPSNATEATEAALMTPKESNVSPSSSSGMSIEKRALKITPIVFRSVSGDAFLVRNDSSSDVQRGLKIWILPRSIPMQVVRDEIKSYIEDIQAFAESYKKLGPYMDPDQTHVFVNRVKKATNEAHNLIDITKDVNSLDFDELYKDTTNIRGVLGHTLSGVAESSGIASGKTDIDGKFVINGISSGDYCLYAARGTDTSVFEWSIPFTLDNKDVQIHLDSDNVFISDRRLLH